MLQISKLDIHYLKRWINVEQFSDNVEMENKNCIWFLFGEKQKLSRFPEKLNLIIQRLENK